MSYEKLIGQPVGILTTTMFYSGTLVRVEPDSFVLIEAEWVAETGVWSDFAQNLSSSESSPFPPDVEVYVSRPQHIIIFGADPKLVQSSKLTRRLTPAK